MSLNELHEVFRRHLHLPDPTSVDAVAVVMVANRMPDNDPVWLMIVGASGGGKTEAVQSAGGLPEVHELSSLTSKTLLSGKQRQGRPASLLHRMDAAGERVLVLKDFTTILSMRREERHEILGQLREVYDGSCSRETGMGDVLTWKGRVGLLAGVTPAIDQHHGVMAQLGERFVYLRIPDSKGTALAEKAFDEEAEREMRDELRAAMTEFVDGVDVGRPPEAPPEVRQAIVRMGRKVAWIRSPVYRDAYGSRDVLQRPSLEAPTRIVKQLRQVWKAAVLIGHENPMGFVERVARDSVRPQDRLEAFEFVAGRQAATSTEIRKHLGLPYTTAKRIREDLEALGLIEVTEVGSDGEPNVYAISEAASDLFPALTPLPNMYTQRGEEKRKERETGVGAQVGQGPFGRLWIEAERFLKEGADATDEPVA